MQAAGELADLLDDRLQVMHGVLETRADVFSILGNRRPEALEVETERDQSLLRPVVEIAFDTTARVVAGRHDSRAGHDQLRAGGRIPDGRRHELREGRESRLGVRRHGLVARVPHDDEAPQAPLDVDRRTDGRPQAVRSGDIGRLARRVVVAAHACWAPGLEHDRAQVLAAALRARAQGGSGARRAPCADQDNGTVRIGSRPPSQRAP